MMAFFIIKCKFSKMLSVPSFLNDEHYICVSLITTSLYTQIARIWSICNGVYIFGKTREDFEC